MSFAIMNNSIKTEETLDTITAMCHQEMTGYRTADFLSTSTSYPLHEQEQQAAPLVDVECRNKMVDWCYQVVDFCKFSRETVEIAMSDLDRYLLTSSGSAALRDRAVFQLVSMTCLYTAVKIHEPEAMDPKLVSTLSRGTYTPEEVEAMESCIVSAVQWRLNPPTTLSFTRLFLQLIEMSKTSISPEMRDAVYDLVKYQSELAVKDYRFIDVPKSVVAFCATMNALESIGLEEKALEQIGYMLGQAIKTDSNDSMIVNVQNCLYESVVTQQQKPSTRSSACRREARDAAPSSSQLASSNKSRRSSFEVSPRSSMAGNL